MKKLLLTSLAAAALSLASLSASAVALTPKSFDVTVSLTPTCRAIAATGNTGVDFLTYTAFQAAAKSNVAGPTYNVECTRNLATAAPTAAFDTANTVVDSATSTTDGVVAGLNYQLTSTRQVPTGTALGIAATASATARVATGNGTPATFAFKITGDMPADQAGSALAAGEPLSAVTQTRTLTISF